MNTDNTSVAGETIDYGPCAFMDAYHPSTVFSSIDHAGRYAFANQPAIAHWNLTRLAETLLPLLAETREAAIGAAEGARDRLDGRASTTARTCPISLRGSCHPKRSGCCGEAWTAATKPSPRSW